MAEKTAYEASNSELVDRFMEACARAGVSNSGLCIDMLAGADVVQMNYLKGAILARLDGQKPPFAPGTKVRVKDGVALPIRAKHYDAPDLKGEQTYTIDRVWYNSIWYLTFLEMADFSELKAQYQAERFCLAESESVAKVVPAR